MQMMTVVKIKPLFYRKFLIKLCITFFTFLKGGKKKMNKNNLMRKGLVIGIMVLFVGAGISSLTTSAFLAKQGYSVKMFEKESWK